MQRFALSRDDRSERAKTVRSKYPEKSLSDNRTKPIWEDGSETALYRGSGCLFKPRPGPTSLSRVKNSGRQISAQMEREGHFEFRRRSDGSVYIHMTNDGVPRWLMELMEAAGLLRDDA
jgi:hypothetical protein